MTVARSVSDVLADHVTLEVESIDRMYLNVYVPRLQHVNGVVWFFRGHRGAPFASSALMDPISKAFVAAIHRFCRERDVPMVDFVKGQRKDDVAHEYLAVPGLRQARRGCCSSGGRRRRRGCFAPRSAATPTPGRPTRGSCPATGVVNQFYVYCVDADFGPFFIKFSSYFPYNAKLCINGNEIRQAAGGQGRDRVHRVGQRVRRLRRPGPVAADLRPADPGEDRRAAA